VPALKSGSLDCVQWLVETAIAGIASKEMRNKARRHEGT